MVWTLPGDRLCENLNKIKENVSSRRYPAILFAKISIKQVFWWFAVYLTSVMKFPIESSFPCYYGIRNERSNVFNLHNHIAIHRADLTLKEIHIYSIDSSLSHLSFFYCSVA